MATRPHMLRLKSEVAKTSYPWLPWG